jgi:hypothetical protein
MDDWFFEVGLAFDADLFISVEDEALFNGVVDHGVEVLEVGDELFILGEDAQYLEGGLLGIEDGELFF